MNSLKMIFTLFAFCFIAALLLAYVDMKTFPVRTRLNLEKEMRARKEVLFMKNGGLNLENFPPGNYVSVIKSGTNEAEFTASNGELQFSKLILDGVDYIEENKALQLKLKGEKPGFTPAFILLRSFNEYKLIIDSDNITGTKEEIDQGRAFLKKNRKFVSSLIEVLMAPVEYREQKAIEVMLDGKKHQLLVESSNFKIGNTDAVLKLEELTASFVTLADKKVEAGQTYKLFSNEEISINELNEYPIMTYYVAYFGETSVGTVFKISPNCFADRIETVIGINSQNAVSGIKILQQAETPGLGARVIEVEKGQSEAWWQKKFHGCRVEELYLSTKDEKKGKIDVITAATITPKKLTQAIRESVESYIRLKESLAGGKK